MTEKTFAEKLRAARRAARLTQAELAEGAQIPKSIIAEWEAGRTVPLSQGQRQVLEWLENYRASDEELTEITPNERDEILKELDDLQQRCQTLEQECETLKRKLRRVCADVPKEPRGNTGMMYGGYDRYEGFGRSLSTPAWSRLSGIPRNSLWRYLKRGMTIEEIYAKRKLPAPPTE